MSIDAMAGRLDFGESAELGGCRLHRIEVYNWGTFHQQVWAFALDGRNALLTGDIGSGKSTLVDALTTLLVPAHRVSYNKAAGAEARERTLDSYVRGFHKAEHNEETGGTRPVALRGPEDYSVVLGVFRDHDAGTATTVAQAFRAREDHKQPDRLFVVADGDLSIAEHFSEFGDSLGDLRKRLRSIGASIHDGFPDYRNAFRRRLGIASEQALDLFHQTVSMKSVDNLNDFVRSHMLEPVDMSRRVDDLVAHFDDLTKAHDAVVRARDQLAALTPIVDALDRWDALGAEVDALSAARSAVPFYFAERIETWAAERIAGLEAELAEVRAATTNIERELGVERERQRDLDSRIAGHGGGRLQQIEGEISRLAGQSKVAKERRNSFNERVGRLGLEAVVDRAGFDAVAARLPEGRVELRERQDGVVNALAQLGAERSAAQAVRDELADDLKSLASRRSSIPRQSLELREWICRELSLSPDDLPFVGELLAVRDDASRWEGAAERVLHSFALSLIVPTDIYAQVARWIDAHHLRGRIVYFRVSTSMTSSPVQDRSASVPVLADLIDVRPDTEYVAWLRRELSRRADHHCVEDTTRFKEFERALTPQGQIKSRDRHEKDDRHAIGDRSRYVLGWDNTGKIELLEAELAEIDRRIEQLDRSDSEQRRLRGELERCSDDLAVVEQAAWSDLDVEGIAAAIEELRGEAELLRAASSELDALTGQLGDVVEAITSLERKKEVLVKRQGAIDSELAAHEAERSEAAVLLSVPDALQQARTSYARVEATFSAAPEGVVIDPAAWAASASVSVLRDARSAVADLIDEQRSSAEAKRGKEATAATKHMTVFRQKYPADVAEVDDSVESGAEYREIHERVLKDDLPRFEEEFRRSLRENTIQEIAQLSAMLDQEGDHIRRHVEVINASLVDIDYNPGRFIRLIPETTPNTEIRGFREDLRACTTGLTGVGDDERYSEERFQQVKRIVDRLKGRADSADADRRWRQRVTDVRQWFVFSASERWRETDEEHERYADSSGKSGGQKEKLAYTVLAASLAYQFSLGERSGRRSSKSDAAGSFRFVAIDEAFGRGSDQSTRFALKLFERLGLQLLIVTPLQKIRVIDPFVQRVGVVNNPDENNSQLVQIDIEDFRRQRDRRGA